MMTLKERLLAHFDFLFVGDRFRITEIHEGDSRGTFAIVRGEEIALRFSIEQDRELVAVHDGYFNWHDIRDVLCIVDTAYVPSDVESFRSLAPALEAQLGNIANAFYIRTHVKTLTSLEWHVARNKLTRSAAVVDTRSGLWSSDELEDFLKREYDFLFLDKRYKIIRRDKEYPFIVVKGKRLRFAFLNDRGDEIISVGRGMLFQTMLGELLLRNSFTISMVRSLYDSNFDSLSLNTFVEWQPVLREEIDKIESLFHPENVSATIKELKRRQREYEEAFLAKFKR